MSLPQDRPLRAIIWCAVSTPEQAKDEKESLPAQERDLRAIAEKNDWQVVDVLKVPGFSRDYLSVEEWVADSASQKEPILAPRKLMQYMDYPRHGEPKFDIFLCRDASRFGRTQSLLTYIAEAILVKMDLLIYTQKTGVIERERARIFIMSEGYASAGEIDTLKKRRHFGMNGNAARGLPTSSRIPYSHKLIRDDKGKAEKLVVDESQRHLWDDVATLLLEGVSWRQMENELWGRWRHGTGGKPFKGGFIRSIMHSAAFWGHSARFYRSSKGKNGQKTDIWLFDESESVPDGILMYRNTHQAVYTGEQAVRIIAELRRRLEVVGNHPLPRAAHRFAGLCLCDECDYQMNTVRRKTRVYLRCACNAKGQVYKRTCGQSKMIRQERVQERINQLVEQILEADSAVAVLAPNVEQEREKLENRLAQLDKSIADEETRAARLIEKQANAPASLADAYDREIIRIGERLELLKSERAAVVAQTPRERPEQKSAVSDLRKMGLDQFWLQDDRTINQMLHQLFGQYRLLVYEGQIIGLDVGSGRKLPRQRVTQL